MVSAWEVYVVMSLDGWGRSLATLCFISTAAVVPLGLTAVMQGSISQTDEEKQQAATLVKWAKRALVLAAVAFVVTSLLPSTKTAAAMIVLPAITSDQVIEPVGKEAKELYGLAKQALRKIAEEPETVEKAQQ